MINLLPPETKSEISAARTNLLLLRYNIMLAAAILFAFLAAGVVYVFLTNTKAAAEQTVTDNESRVGDYASVESESETFKKNLANAKQILDDDVTYTKVILEISSLLPEGIVLDNLSLDSAQFGQPTVLAARAKDYPTAVSLKSALERSDLFSDVSLQTISDSGQVEDQYKLNVSLSVTIAKDAAK